MAIYVGILFTVEEIPVCKEIYTLGFSSADRDKTDTARHVTKQGEPQNSH